MYVDSNTNSQTYWQKEISHAMSGTIFFTCLTFAISALSAALRISAWPAAPGRWGRRQQDFRKVKADVEPGLACCDKFFDCAKSNCVEKSRDLRAPCQLDWERTGRPAAREHNEYEETRSGRAEPGTPECPWKSYEYEETRRFRKLRHRRYWQNLATQSPYIYCLLTASSEGFLECETKIWSLPWRQNGKPRCGRSFIWELVTDQTGITGIPVIDWQQQMWQRTNLLTDNAVQFATAKTCVFSDSVLCLGGISPDPVRAWKDKINWFMESRQFRELDRVDGGADGVRVENFKGFTTLGILAEIQKMMTEIKCEPKHFQGRIIFMSTYNDIEWRKQRNRGNCIANSFNVADYARKCEPGCWSCLGPGTEKKWYGTRVYKPNGEWDEVAQVMMDHFSESGHPVLRGSSAFEREELKSKGKGRSTIHFNGSDETIDVILRTSISVNQLSIYGAAADMCGDQAWVVSRNSKGAGETRSAWESGNHVNATRNVDNKSNFSDWCRSTGKLVAWMTKLCSNGGLAKTVEKEQFFMTLDDDQLDRLNGSCREYTLPRSDQSPQVKRWIRGNTKIGPVLDVTVCYHQGRSGVEIMIKFLFGNKTCSWVRIVNGINKHVTERQKRFTLQVLERRVQGNLLRRLDHDRHQIWRCLLCLCHTVNESG